MMTRGWAGRWPAWALWWTLCAGCAPPEPADVVVDENGRPVEGALVTVRHEASGRAFTVYSDSAGVYTLPSLPDGELAIEARGPAAEATPRWSGRGAAVDLGGRLALGPARERDEPPASAFLAQLPDGPHKRRVVVDCGGCHTFGSLHARKDGRERTPEEWEEAIGRMIAMAGQGTGFPIISGHADAAADAAWLAAALAGAPWPAAPAVASALTRGAHGAVLTEYSVPEPMDLPHDVAVAGDGRVLVTGMFTHRMYVLDPASGAFETVPIPVQNANPRAVDIDAGGRWWVLLGSPQRIASHDPTTGTWRDYPIGMYPHSIALDSRGRVWFNGHFSVAPEWIASLDPETGDVARYEVPPSSERARTESTIPYGLRVDPDDVVWATQLRGNHLIRFDPASGESRLFEMPTDEAGPRRPDLAADGSIWIPEFGANKIARFEPATGTVTEIDFPVRDAAPYVIRVDRARDRVWIGTGHADVVASYEPAHERFTVYPLPTRGALIRHLDIDDRTGEVWFAYGASPGPPSKILRLQPR